MSMEWVVQFAFPWMVSDDEEPKKEEKRSKGAPRWPKPLAMAIAEVGLREFETDAKARVYNPTLGEYVAYAINKEGNLESFDGKDNRDTKRP